jgi:crossover junction endodeoxyribonuclease RuvC
MALTRILGIDPGLENTGWGIIDQEGSRLVFVAAGIIKTDSKQKLFKRLVKISTELSHIIDKFKPHTSAIEETFVNVNAASSLKLGQARGVAILAPASQNIDVHEYAANLIKKSIVGSGHASKDQIGMMVKMLLPNCGEVGLDAADALAVAICHAHHYQSGQILNSALMAAKN